MSISAWKMLPLTAMLALTTNISFADVVTPPDLAATKTADTSPPATNCPSPPKLKEGWYMGAQIGYDSFRVRNTVANPGSYAFNSNPVLAANGWLAGLILGYGEMYYPWFYWGGEIFANSNNFNQAFQATTTSSYSNAINTSSVIGLAFLPGVRFTDDTMAYAKLGWSRAILKTEETVTGTADANQVNDSSQFMFGVGIETLIMNQWSLRTEFNHLYYNSYNTTVPYRTKVSPSDNQFTLGLIYHFWQ